MQNCCLGNLTFLSPPRALLGLPGIYLNPVMRLDLQLVILDQPGLINADGLWVESLNPHDAKLLRLGRQIRQTLRKATKDAQVDRAVRRLSADEARVLVAQMRTPSRPAKSVKNCQATRPDRAPLVACHSMASARSFSGETSTP